MDLDRIKRSMWLRELYLKLVLPLSYPLILNIEPTNRCNLSCGFCPRKISRRPETDLDWSLFLSLVAELNREGPILRIFLQKDGEPLLYPRISEMVEILYKAKAAKSIGIITNGTLLTGEKFLELAAAGLDDLIVSIDAVDAEEYRRIKGANLYNSVVKNVIGAMTIKKSLGLKKPLIKARMVERKGQSEKVAEFTNFWKDKCDMVDITPFHTWMGAIEDQRCYNSTERFPCSLLWYTGVINSDGMVSPCCVDYNCDGSLGRLEKDGFKPIWNGPVLQELRNAHLKGRYSDTKICGSCEYWQIKENIGRWLKRKFRKNIDAK